MNTKLTLSIDTKVISEAKKSLQTRDKSLSRLIEEYLRVLITTKTKQTTPVAGVVPELTGIARLGVGAEDKELITEYLLEKYR